MLNEPVDVIQVGLALAAAIAVDAFVVRMTIVPAVMAVVGARVWWLPRWLDRLLPDVHVEGARAVGDVGQGDRERGRGRPVRN